MIAISGKMIVFAYLETSDPATSHIAPESFPVTPVYRKLKETLTAGFMKLRRPGLKRSSEHERGISAVLKILCQSL
jgi:hypothetical protein